MSLITRCPACSTLFKVVPDQLRISAGWVRCGHCNEVFDASVSILSYEESVAVVPKVAPAGASATASARLTEAPRSEDQPGWPLAHPGDEPGRASVLAGSAGAPMIERPPSSRAKSTTAAVPSGSMRRARDEQAGLLHQADTVATSANGPAEVQVDPPPGFARPPGVRYGDPKDVSSPIDLLRVRRRDKATEARAADADSETALESRPAKPVAADQAWAPSTRHRASQPITRLQSLDQDSMPAPDPSFMRQARRRAFWRSGPMRGALGLLLLVLATALAGQMVYTHRDWVAAREPRAVPLLKAACLRLGCTIEPYRNLDAITIDSSSFNRVSPGNFHLSLTLRNASDLAVATPALELTLTNAQDQAILRRVLRPTDFSAAPSLPARGDWSGASALTVTSVPDQLSIVGYRLLAFYP